MLIKKTETLEPTTETMAFISNGTSSMLMSGKESQAKEK
jgi:hypothetical protein